MYQTNNRPIYNQLVNDLKIRLTRTKTVGVFVSGGFDSAMLLYVLCKIKKDFNLGFNLLVCTVPRHDDSVVHSTRVVDWANTQFNENISIVFLGNPDLHHSEQVKSGCIHALHENLADWFLLADTATPHHMTNGPQRSPSGTSRIYQPWLGNTKDHVVKLMQELENYDVMTVTHSCTESKKLRCSKCWQCRERAWAFETVGIIDTGTM